MAAPKTASVIRRAFIADPSFQLWRGHHVAYDLAVRAALEKLGIKVIILANRAAETSLTESGAIWKTFCRTDLGVVTARACIKRWRHRAWLGTVFLLASPWALAAGLARLGLGLAQKMPDGPPKSAWSRLLAWMIKHRPARQVSWPGVCRSLIDYFEAIEALENNDFGTGDLLFVPTVTACTLPLWAILAGRLARKKNGGQLTLMFRYPPDFIRATPVARFFWRKLARTARSRAAAIRGVTDSARLAGAYRGLWPDPLIVLPIPARGTMSSRTTVGAECLKCVSLGNARAEKGLAEILGAVKLLRESGFNTAFALQVNNPDSRCSGELMEFAKEVPDGVELFHEPLVPEDYERLLGSADIVLLPYWPEVYAARTSGIMTEALTAGKIIVATEGTWMAEELKRFKAGCELIPDRNAEALAEAIKTITLTPEPYLLKAAAAAEAARLFHNADVLARQLLNDAQL